MSSCVEVVWTSELFASAEHSMIRHTPGRRAVTGTAVIGHSERPATIRYELDIGDGWTTDEARIAIESAGLSKVIRLVRNDDRWTLNDGPRPDLDGCTNVDLGWSPVTNTLPLRSGVNAVGASMTSRSAWVRFPELDVVAAEQTYTRTDPESVHYSSSTFAADLTVTPDGVVTTYGEGLWRAAVLRRLD